MFNKNNFDEITCSSLDLAEKLVEAFEVDWPNVIENIEKAIADNDAKHLEEWAHRLKGSLRVFCATKAEILAEKLENIGASSDLKDAPELYIELKDAVIKTIDDIKTYIQTELSA